MPGRPCRPRHPRISARGCATCASGGNGRCSRSDRTGIGLSSLSKIERDQLSPTVTTLQRIAAAYEIDSATMMAGTCRNAWPCPELSRKLMTPIMTTVDARSVEDYAEWAGYEAEVFVHVPSGAMVVHSQIYEPTRLAAGDPMYYDGSTPSITAPRSVRCP